MFLEEKLVTIFTDRVALEFSDKLFMDIIDQAISYVGFHPFQALDSTFTKNLDNMFGTLGWTYQAHLDLSFVVVSARVLRVKEDGGSTVVGKLRNLVGIAFEHRNSVTQRIRTYSSARGTTRYNHLKTAWSWLETLFPTGPPRQGNSAEAREKLITEVEKVLETAEKVVQDIADPADTKCVTKQWFVAMVGVFEAAETVENFCQSCVLCDAGEFDAETSAANIALANRVVTWLCDGLTKVFIGRDHFVAEMKVITTMGPEANEDMVDRAGGRLAWCSHAFAMLYEFFNSCPMCHTAGLLAEWFNEVMETYDNSCKDDITVAVKLRSWSEKHARWVSLRKASRKAEADDKNAGQDLEVKHRVVDLSQAFINHTKDIDVDHLILDFIWSFVKTGHDSDLQVLISVGEECAGALPASCTELLQSLKSASLLTALHAKVVVEGKSTGLLEVSRILQVAGTIAPKVQEKLGLTNLTDALQKDFGTRLVALLNSLDSTFIAEFNAFHVSNSLIKVTKSWTFTGVYGYLQNDTIPAEQENTTKKIDAYLAHFDSQMSLLDKLVDDVPNLFWLSTDQLQALGEHKRQATTIRERVLITRKYTAILLAVNVLLSTAEEHKEKRLVKVRAYIQSKLNLKLSELPPNLVERLQSTGSKDEPTAPTDENADADASAAPKSKAQRSRGSGSDGPKRRKLAVSLST